MGGENGDLIIQMKVAPHRYFERKGTDIYLETPVSVTEAGLGTKIEAPTPGGGRTTVTIPAGSRSGQKLRLKGKGIVGQKGGATGDLFLVLKIVPPEKIDEESKRLLEEFGRRNPQPGLRGEW